MSERVFSVVEIVTAVDNYKQQASTVASQLQELEKHAEVLQAQRHMINGAIVAFETLLNSPAAVETASDSDIAQPDAAHFMGIPEGNAALATAETPAVSVDPPGCANEI